MDFKSQVNKYAVHFEIFFPDSLPEQTPPPSNAVYLEFYQFFWFIKEVNYILHK
jgi:hypothetical protein